MSKQIDRDGTFRGFISEQGVGVSKNGHVQLKAVFNATEMWDADTEQWLDWSCYDETELTGYLYLLKSDNTWFKTATQLMKALGWSGESWDDLNNGDFSGTIIQFRVEQDDYNGKKSLKVAWVDHRDATPGTSVQKLDADGLKSLNARCKGAFKELTGGPKPKTVPAVPKMNVTETAVESAPVADKKPAKRGRPAAAKPPAKPAPTSKAPTPTPKADDAEEKPEDTNNSGSCSNADEAWEQVEAAIDYTVTPKAQVEEVWLKAVEDLGGTEAVNATHGWDEVKEIVLVTLIN